MTQPSKPTRNAASTRERILSVAQHHFKVNGYDACGLRDIAADAGVNVALINRYFGSKVELFQKAVVDALQVDDLLSGNKDTFGQDIASRMTWKDFDEDDFDPLLAFVKSLGSPAVGPLLSARLTDHLVPAIARWIGGKAAKERAALILSTLLGFDMLRRMAKLDSLQNGNRKAIVALAARTLQGYVDGMPEQGDRSRPAKSRPAKR